MKLFRYILLTFMMVGFGAGCVTRTTRHVASTSASGQGRTEEGEEHQNGEAEADPNRRRAGGVAKHGCPAARGVGGHVERFHAELYPRQVTLRTLRHNTTARDAKVTG